MPQNIQQFEESLPKDIIEPIATAQSPEEVVNVLNQLSQSQEGNQIISTMFQAFQKSLTSKMFNGGKLKQLLDKCQNGNKITTPRKDGVMGEASSEILSDIVNNKHHADNEFASHIKQYINTNHIKPESIHDIETDRKSVV